MKKMEKDDNRQYVKFSIGAKLVSIISVMTILLLSWLRGSADRMSESARKKIIVQ